MIHFGSHELPENRRERGREKKRFVLWLLLLLRKVDCVDVDRGLKMTE